MIARIERLGKYWPLIFVLPVAILLIFVGDFYFSRGSDFSDMAITHYPNALWIQRSVLNWGQIPLWSSTILSGYPFIANPLSGLLYPPGWLGLLLQEPGGLNFCMVLHLLWGGIGMYRFMRAEGATHLPAVLGAIAFEALPKLFGHVAAGHVTLIYAAAWTPWLLLAEKQGRQGWRKTALCFSMIVLADLRWAALAGLLWAVYGIHLASGEGLPNLGKTGFRLGKILLGVGLATLLSAVLLLPLWEYTAASTRALMTARDSLALSMPPVQILGLLAPSLGGSAEWIVYPGAGILVLACIGLGLPQARARIGFWLGLAGAALLFSLGSNLPGMTALVRLPGLNLLRVPPRALILSGFGLIVAAVWVLQTLIDQPQSLRQMKRINPILFLVGVTFMVLALAVLGWAVTGKFQAGFSLGGAALAGNLVLVFLYRAERLSSQRFTILITAWLMLDLGICNAAGMDFRQPGLVLGQGAAAAQFLKSQPGVFRVYSPSYSLPQQTAAYQGLELTDGVDPLQLLRYASFMESASGVGSGGYSVTLPAFQNGEPATDNQNAMPNVRQLGLLNVGYVCAEYDLSEPGLEEVARFGQTRVYRNTFVLPRAWVQDPNSALGESILREASFRSSANTITVWAEGPGLLVLSEIAYPGWATWLDGKKISSATRSDLLREISLPAGNHEVSMIFQPTSFQVGGLISILAWSALAGWELFHSWRTK